MSGRMGADGEARRERVRAVIRAARALADPRDARGREARACLVRTSGLSAEGVELALSEHLETEATDRDIAALIGACGTAPRCHVVLSAAVPTAALRAIALAVATAPEAVIRPSRRDPDVARLLTAALASDERFRRAGGSIAVALSDERGVPDARAGDEVHLYGEDASIAAIAAAIAPGATVRRHGTGLGIALVSSLADVEAAADAIARDIVPFDQRGCLSPRFVLVEGGADRVDAVSAALARALDALGARIPRGHIDDATAAAIAMHAATLQAIGTWTSGRSFGVGSVAEPTALVLPPAARIAHVAGASSPSALGALLEPWAHYVTALGSAEPASELARAAAALVPHARRSALGRMQHPPLDGPVDRRAELR